MGSLLSPLATQQDVEDALGRPLESDEASRIGFLLEKLSADFRHVARRDFTVNTYVQRRKIDGGGKVWLPQAPVISVESAIDDHGAQVPFRMLPGGIIVDTSSRDFVTVTYTAGFEEIPRVIVLRIADSAKRALTVSSAPLAAQGVDQVTRTTGPFSQTMHMAAWAVGGQTMLTPEAMELAKSCQRVKRGHTWHTL
ncbi:MAG: hypothetical protein KIC38_01790 [Actinomycetaceae bacterium]|nr:hypothetical protein [Actinomycetaceae bacterium]